MSKTLLVNEWSDDEGENYEMFLFPLTTLSSPRQKIESGTGKWFLGETKDLTQLPEIARHHGCKTITITLEDA